MCCAADNHNYMCHTYAKEFLDSNFSYAVMDKKINFHEIAPNSTYSHNYICYFLDQLLHPYKFHGRDMLGILFFIFASCELLKQHTVNQSCAYYLPKKNPIKNIYTSEY